MEIMNKFGEAMRQLDEHLRAQRRPHETTGICYTKLISSIEKG